MKITESIQEFIVGVARYHVVGTQGDKVTLRIDYKNNTFEFEKGSKRLDQQFQQEVSEIARDLLRRKHGVNFARQAR